nr:hypothetical protein [Tanacetum cinerariifolium]
MFNMNERVYNPQSQIQSVRHPVSLFHPQASQVIYPQPSMFHPQDSQVIYPQRSMIHRQSYQVSHPQSSHVIHQQTSQAPAAPRQIDSSFFLSSNNHIEILSDPVYQDAIKERQTLSCVDNSSKSNDDMARKYTHTNTVQHADCFKQKMLLVQLQEAGIQLSKDQLTILADTKERIDFGPSAFRVTTNALFQADGVEVYDLDCDDLPNAQPSFMANISSSTSDALSEDVHETQQDAVHNSTPSAQQDALILSVIEQLRTQVMNCTKINLDNKSVNDTLTAKFERYKEQVKFLTEGKNVDLTNRVIVSDSCEQSVKIDRLKQILSGQVKEKESLMQTVTLLKNDFKKEESRNIDREIVLEKKIKLLDNIKARQLKPKLYDGDVIKNNCAIVIPDSEETLMLAEESRSKMLLKQKDPMVLEKKVNTKPIDYAALNKLSKDFETHFFPQTKFSAKQVFCSSSDPIPSNRPTTVEVPSELPKVSMALDQHRLESKTFDFQNERLLEQVISKDIVNIMVDASVNNAYSQKKDIVIKKLKERIKSLSGNVEKDNVKKDIEEIETINIELDHRVSKLVAENEHLKQTYKQLYDLIEPACILSKEQYDAIINQVNLKSVKNFDLNVSFQEQALVITALKEELRELKGKAVVENAVTPPTIAPVVHKIDLEPLSPKLKNNREAHVDYIRITKENADTLRAIVEQARTSNPLDNVLAYALNDRDRAKAVKSMIMKEWKPIGKMFKNVGYKWVLIGRTFTIIGTKCPLTRFTSTKIVPHRKPVKST